GSIAPSDAGLLVYRELDDAIGLTVVSDMLACGSSRNCGRSHHQRQHETFDSHAFKSNRQKECVQMPGRWPDQALDQAFGLPEGAGRRPHLASVFQRNRKSPNIHTGSGVIVGNVGGYQDVPCGCGIPWEGATTIMESNIERHQMAVDWNERRRA